MSSIPISTKHGINPAIEVCSRCGQETGAILLSGKSNKYRCNGCRKTYYGQIGAWRKSGCPMCRDTQQPEIIKFDVELPKRLAGSLCKACQEEEERFRSEVRIGGVRWKCKDCGRFGVIKAESEFAQEFRNKYPDVGIEFDKERCPACGPNKVTDDAA